MEIDAGESEAGGFCWIFGHVQGPAYDNKDFRQAGFQKPVLCVTNFITPAVELEPRKTNLNIQQVIKSMENLVPLES